MAIVGKGCYRKINTGHCPLVDKNCKKRCKRGHGTCCLICTLTSETVTIVGDSSTDGTSGVAVIQVQVQKETELTETKFIEEGALNATKLKYVDKIRDMLLEINNPEMINLPK
ncbi:hypothetical protein Ddye_014594 [Dipteronia dyeriana]|uniref:Uncharacterized protein n=1 Tax=Dipteronia dyeriana TaxID=168575 RepID=A0AAD9X8N5_9ROSI|nr:hypothetical protein Ddye_014594 [Dipteronia dyeriana]